MIGTVAGRNELPVGLDRHPAAEGVPGPGRAGHQRVADPMTEQRVETPGRAVATPQHVIESAPTITRTTHPDRHPQPPNRCSQIAPSHASDLTSLALSVASGYTLSVRKPSARRPARSDARQIARRFREPSSPPDRACRVAGRPRSRGSRRPRRPSPAAVRTSSLTARGARPIDASSPLALPLAAAAPRR
jgi:hypothetical protein